MLRFSTESRTSRCCGTMTDFSGCMRSGVDGRCLTRVGKKPDKKYICDKTEDNLESSKTHSVNNLSDINMESFTD